MIPSSFWMIQYSCTMGNVGSCALGAQPTHFHFIFSSLVTSQPYKRSKTIHISTHPSLIHTVHKGAGAHPSRHGVKAGDNLHRSPDYHRATHTCSHPHLCRSLESPVKQQFMSLDCGQREHASSTQKVHRPRSQTQNLVADHSTTVPPLAELFIDSICCNIDNIMRSSSVKKSTSLI